MSVEQSLRVAKKHASNQNWRQAQAALKLGRDKYSKNKRLRNQSEALRKALSEKCDPKGALREQVVHLHHQKMYQEIIKHGPEWIDTYPDSPLIWKVVANTYAMTGNHAVAKKCFDQALLLVPDDFSCLSGLADCLRNLGQTNMAIDAYLLALNEDPKSQHLLNNLSNSYRDLGQFDLAASTLEAACQIRKDLRVQNNYLGLLILQNRLDEADLIAASMELGIADISVLNNIAQLRQLQGDLPLAVTLFDEIASLEPTKTANHVNAQISRSKIAQWCSPSQFPSIFELLENDLSAVQPHSALALVDDPWIQRDIAKHFVDASFPKVLRAVIPPPSSPPDKIRIAYFSSDFYNHATMHLMRSFFASHSLERFEIYIYSYGPRIEDPYRIELETCIKNVHDVGHLSDQEIAALSRHHGIHIAVDLKGHTAGNRSKLFTYGAAPIQVAWIGFPGTSGHPCFDYAIVDDVVVPKELHGSFTEKLIVMPNCYQVNDSSRRQSDTTLSRQQEGLPEGSFVFSCFNNGYKISSVEFDIWMRLLKAKSNSVLWLLAQNDYFTDNIRQEAAKRGIEPDRLIFAARKSPKENIARQALADLFLDTFNCNAHTTASDALWGGLPVLTLQGQQFAARVASSLLTAANLPELITHSPEAYEARALELADNPARLHDIKRKLLAKTRISPLFDTMTFTRQLEDRFTHALQLFLDGKELTNIV
jgi:predicted O-linked N-acetylglucosamine transferase (SPINDLY family)